MATLHNPNLKPHDAPDLRALVEARFQASMNVPEAFFSAESEQIAQACWAMAMRFHKGGRLLAFGSGSAATDAQHVSVEFVHPVIVGKRALPALALTNDSAALTGLDAMRDQRQRPGTQEQTPSPARSP